MAFDYDASPRSVMRAFRRWSGVAVLALLLAGGVIYGGYLLHWWFAGQNANREAHIIRNGFSNQQTLREQVTQQIANIDAETVSIAQAAGNPGEIAALEAQRIATVNIACQDASEVTGDPLPASQQAWIRQDCLVGSIRPGSRYDSTGGTQ
jgi:hypothetical protein